MLYYIKSICENGKFGVLPQESYNVLVETIFCELIKFFVLLDNYMKTKGNFAA